MVEVTPASDGRAVLGDEDRGVSVSFSVCSGSESRAYLLLNETCEGPKG